MGSLIVVLIQPNIQILLKLFNGVVNLFSERHCIKLILDRSVKTFANSICLRVPGFGPGVINILHCKVKLVFMVFPCPTELRTSVGENTQQPDATFLKESYNPVVEQICGHQGVFAVVKLSLGNLGISINKSLLINPPYTFNGSNIIGVLCSWIFR